MNNIKLMDATRSFFKNFNWTDLAAEYAKLATQPENI